MDDPNSDLNFKKSKGWISGKICWNYIEGIFLGIVLVIRNFWNCSMKTLHISVLQEIETEVFDRQNFVLSASFKETLVIMTTLFMNVILIAAFLKQFWAKVSELAQYQYKVQWKLGNTGLIQWYLTYFTTSDQVCNCNCGGLSCHSFFGPQTVSNCDLNLKYQC